jgi:hypothetical protein
MKALACITAAAALVALTTPAVAQFAKPAYSGERDR